MINFLTNCSFCKDNGIFSTIYLVKTIIGAVFIIIPIILIVLIIIDFAKNAIAGKEEDMKKNRNLAIKRMIYAIAIFFVPTIVNVFMNILYRNVDSSSEQSFLQCWANADDVNKVNQCNKEALANEMASDILKQTQSNEKLNEYKEKVNNNKGSGGVTVKPDDDNSSNNNGDSGSSTDSNLPSTIENYTVYVGDSRTNVMCIHTHLAPTGGGSYNKKEKCIVAPGKGYDWFHDTARGLIKQELASNSDANIVMESLGVNDISPKYKPGQDVNTAGNEVAEKYAVDYIELAKAYPKAKFVVVSVTYANESKKDVIFYKLTNSIIDNFNNKLKDKISGVSNIVFCDINKALGNNYKYASHLDDGLHYYEDSDNQKILDEIRKCI